MQASSELDAETFQPRLRTHDHNSPSSGDLQNADVLLFRICACAGTVLGCSVFGLLFGGVFGLLFGILLSPIYAIYVQGSAATLCWILWLDRFRIVFAVLGGAFTGICATIATLGRAGDSGTVTVLTAGVFGGIGAGAATTWFTVKTAAWQTLYADAAAGRWTFSLGSMFIRFTVLCVLPASWIVAIRAFLDLRNP